MKKIIVSGDSDLRLYETRCGHCGCLFRYTKDELYENKNIIGHPLSVACPWCLEEIRVDTINGQLSPILENAKRMLDKYTPDYHETTDDEDK